MLDTLRKGAGSWIAQIFIAVLVITFAIWGVSDVFNGFRSDTIASVGRTYITIPEFQRQYDLAIRQFNQQYNQQLTADTARNTGIPNDVLGRLIADATLNDAARSLGLGISDQTLAEQIVADPSFHGTTGGFDRSYFTQLLRSAGLTEDAYMAQLRAGYVRQQISDALAGGTKTPEAYLRAIHEYRNEERTISYVVLLPNIVGQIADPTDTDLQTYFDAHKSDYRAPELRAVSVLRLSPADLAKPDEVTDEDAKKAYDTQIAAFTKPEQRKVDQVVFKDRATADAASAALAGGKTFDDILAEQKLKPEDVNLGLVTKEKIIDPKVADAAFSLSANTVSPVIDGTFGPVILRVTEVQPASTTSFEDAKADLKKKIATDRAGAEIADQKDVIEDARAGGAALDEAAAKFALKVTKFPAVDKNGADDKGTAIKDLPGGPGLVNAAFESDVGVENDPLPFEGGFVWYEVTGVTAEHDRNLAEVRDKVIADWKRDQVETRLAAKANELRDQLAKGEDIAKVATELSLTVKTSDKVTRATPTSADLTASVREQAFTVPKGGAAVANGPADQSKVVLVVTDANVPPYLAGAPEVTQSGSQLADQLSTDYLRQYVVELQNTLGIRVNSTAFQQAIGQPSS